MGLMQKKQICKNENSLGDEGSVGGTPTVAVGTTALPKKPGLP
jgi:hypothetical protein